MRIMRIQSSNPKSYAGSLLRPDGCTTPGRNLWAASLLFEHSQHVHCQGRWPSQGDASYHARSTREFHHQWRALWFLQLHHSPARRLLRRRARHVGPHARPYIQPPLLHSNCPRHWRGWSFCTPRRGLKIRVQPVHETPQQETPACFQVLLPQLEDLGGLPHTDLLEKV